jgi:hypothetical protein
VTDLEIAQTRRTEILTLLTTLPKATSVGEGGRSVSIDRAGLLAELKQLTELIPMLAGPFAITSTARGGVG